MNNSTSNEYTQEVLRLVEVEKTLNEMCIAAFKQLENYQEKIEEGNLTEADMNNMSLLCDELTAATKQHDLVIEKMCELKLFPPGDYEHLQISPHLAIAYEKLSESLEKMEPITSKKTKKTISSSTILKWIKK